jgi:hypothetical protein
VAGSPRGERRAKARAGEPKERQGERERDCVVSPPVARQRPPFVCDALKGEVGRYITNPTVGAAVLSSVSFYLSLCSRSEPAEGSCGSGRWTMSWSLFLVLVHSSLVPLAALSISSSRFPTPLSHAPTLVSLTLSPRDGGPLQLWAMGTMGTMGLMVALGGRCV